jgi:hypothetical protein
MGIGQNDRSAMTGSTQLQFKRGSDGFHLPDYLYDDERDSKYSMFTRHKLSDLTTDWYAAGGDERLSIAVHMDTVRDDANKHWARERVSGYLQGIYNDQLGGGIGGQLFARGAGISQDELDSKNFRNNIFAALTTQNRGSNVGVNTDTTRVGRWMSKAEYDKMVKTGKVPESFTGTTHVASPADINAFGKQAKPGSIYVEFDVPSSSLKPTNEGWSKIVGPNSLEGRLEAKKGKPIPEMPSITNLKIKGSK